MSTAFEPAYLALWRAGELQKRVDVARQRLAACHMCPRECGVNRLEGERGFCQTGRNAVVSSFSAHFGEEAALVGLGGSGTIFFTYCNLGCLYCQNYDISHAGMGREVESDELASMMIHLQGHGCHNINVVTPSHVVPQILDGLLIAAKEGLRLPLVYNSGGYDCLETLRLLDGMVDIYMPDMKYSDPEMGQRYSGVPDYPQRNREAVNEMYRQVGDLRLDDRGIALSGLLVRHLVLPEGRAGTSNISTFLAVEISRDTYINVMDQYRPCYRAGEFNELNRPLSRVEYDAAVQAVLNAGLHRLDDRQSRLLRWFLR